MEKKRDVASLVLLFFFLLVLVVWLIGPVQKWVTWSHLLEHIIETILVSLLAIIIIKKIIKSVKRLRLRKTLIILVLILIGLLFGLLSVFHAKIFETILSLEIFAAVMIYIFQAPLLNIISFLYIIKTQIYSVGDRIKINKYKGDVIAINVLTTKIRQVGGEYLQSSTLSGKIVTIPNSLLLTEPLVNYTKETPYIWVSIPFQLSYVTDSRFVIKNMKKIVEKQIKPYLEDFEKKYKKFLRDFKIKEEREIIKVFMRPIESWIEITINFPVKPKEQVTMLTKITQEIVEFFKKHPKKAGFPKGTSR